MVFQANPFPWLQFAIYLTQTPFSTITPALSMSRTVDFLHVVGFTMRVDWLVGVRVVSISYWLLTVEPIGWLLSLRT